MTEARYTVCVPGGLTPIVHKHPADSRADAEEVLADYPEGASYWIIDNSDPDQRLRVEDLA